MLILQWYDKNNKLLLVLVLFTVAGIGMYSIGTAIIQLVDYLVHDGEMCHGSSLSHCVPVEVLNN